MNPEILESLLHVSNQDELVGKTQQIVQSLGFRHFIFALRLLPRDAGQGVDLLMGTYPQDYLERYGRENYLVVDPVVAHALRYHRPLVWSNALFTLPKAQAMYEEARAAGISAGISLSVHDAPRGHIGLFGFANEADADRQAPLIQTQAATIQLLASYYHEAYCHLLQGPAPEDAATTRPLALREKDCLMWLTEGLEAHQIGQVLKISENQVYKHLEQARRKLGAASMPQAVARALLQGITEQPRQRPLVLVDQGGQQILGRRQLALRLESRLQHSTPLALLLLDVDRFDRLRDSLGPSASEALQSCVIHRLKTKPALGPALIPLEGSLLALVMEPGENESQDAMGRLAQSALEVPIEMDGHRFHLSLSVGIACAPRDGDNWQTLVQHAEHALHEARRIGPGRILHFSPDTSRRLEEDVYMENRLHLALERNAQGLAVHFQPIVHTASGRIIGFEALCRWEDEILGQVSPDRFIPMAEHAGLIVPLGDWVLDQALGQLARWRAEGLAVFMAVNVSAIQFQNGALVQAVMAALTRHGLPPSCLELEITESLLLESHPSIQTTLANLQAAGITLAIDDFGTGYASLGYLQRMPIAILKLDQSFVRNAYCTPRNATLVEAALRMARGLALEVVAEGVESEADRQFLATLGCERWQGHLSSRPASAADPEFCRLLEKLAARPTTL